MNRSILILLIILVSPGIVKSQPQIIGFGKLKLGTGISSVNADYKITIEPISKYRDYISKVYGGITWIDIFQLVCDSTTNNPLPETSLDKRVTVYYVTKYPVTADIELTGIKLKFFNDSLINIYCNESEQLAEALTEKYGNPKTSVYTKDHQFTYSLTGNQVTKTDKTYTTKWETNNPNIKCVRVVMSWFDNQGKEDFLSYIQLSDNTHKNDIKQAETIVKERIANRELQKKKQGLQDF